MRSQGPWQKKDTKVVDARSTMADTRTMRHVTRTHATAERGPLLPVDAIEIVRPEPGGTWMAHFLGPQAANIRHLFGTDTVPTPFHGSCKIETVLAGVQSRNPGMGVTVAVS